MDWNNNILVILIVCAYFENGFGYTLHQSPSDTLKPENQTETIPTGYLLFQNSYYKYFNHATNWETAQNICERDGGHLVIINSKDEASLLMRLMKENPHEIGGFCLEGYIHVGLRKKPDEEKAPWITVDGELLENSGYNEWAPGEPNSWHNIEYCGTFYRDGGLNDFPCWCSKAFVCEIPAKEFVESPKLEKVDNSLNSLQSSIESNVGSLFDFHDDSSSVSAEHSPDKHENSAESFTNTQEISNKVQEPENTSPLQELDNSQDSLDDSSESQNHYSDNYDDSTENNEYSSDNVDHSLNKSEYSSKNSAETEEETDEVQEVENDILSTPKPENIVKPVDSFKDYSQNEEILKDFDSIKDSSDNVNEILNKSNYSQESSSEDPGQVEDEVQGPKRKKYISLLFKKITSLWDHIS